MKKLKSRLSAVIMVLVLALGMTGCGSDKTSGNETTTEAGANGQSLAGVAETVYPLEITDSNGDVITLDSEPERVVSVAPNLTELMYKLNAGDKLVGRSDYCDYPAEVSEVDSVGSIQTPDIEKIISLNPDVIIVSAIFDEENSKRLEELDIPVITLYEEHDVTGVYNMIETLGKIINRNDEAASCVEEMKTTIAEVEEVVKGLDMPTVYYVVGYGEYGDYTAGGDTFVGEILEVAGGDNIAKDISGWSITLEELVEADPSIIIISEFMKDDFMASPNYSDLTAVKEGKVYTIDVNMLERQGYRNAEGIKALAEIFHPEAF